MTQAVTLNHLLAIRGLNGKQFARLLDTTESEVSRLRAKQTDKITPKRREQIIEALELTAGEVAALGWEKEETRA